jgi:hypothetical protein
MLVLAWWATIIGMILATLLVVFTIGEVARVLTERFFRWWYRR